MIDWLQEKNHLHNEFCALFAISRCKYKVQKVEKSALGTVYVCTHGAPKHSTKGCRRTYLSQRDLHSHHMHRHTPKPTSSKQQPAQPGSITVAAPVPPVPNQLPMTQQQAQQQASQQKQQIGQAQVGARGLLSPSQSQTLPIGGMIMTSNSAQSSPLLPGLGGLSAGMTGQASPHMQQPSVSPKPSALQQQQQQNLGLSYSGGQPIQQHNPDVFRPLDLGNMVPPNSMQQQPHRHMHQPPPQPQLQSQQQPGLRAAPVSHMQLGMAGGQQPSFGQPATHFQHVPPPTNQMPQQAQQMGGNPVQPNMLSPGMHMGQHHHNQQPQHQQQHQPQRQVSSQHMETFSPQNPPPNAASSPMAMANASQSRTNNLITVPIQDEGQYRPLPYVNTSIVNQSNTAQVSSFSPQARSNSATYSQSFPSHGMAGGFLGKPSGVGGGLQPQGIMGAGSGDPNQGMNFNQGNQGNPQNLNFNNQADSHRPGPGMGMNYNQPGGQGVAPPRLGFNQPGMQQNNAPGMQSFPHSVRMNQMPGRPGPGGNMTRGLVQAINMVAAASRPHPSPSGGSGMMQAGPPLNAQGGGGNNRFPGPPSGRWPAPRGMQPRMGGNQGQPRPHDGSFNHGPPYFNQ